MRQVLVKYDDFDKKGIRKNGEKLPLSGCVRGSGVGFRNVDSIEILDSEKDGVIRGVALIFGDKTEQRKYKEMLKKNL